MWSLVISNRKFISFITKVIFNKKNNSNDTLIKWKRNIFKTFLLKIFTVGIISMKFLNRNKKKIVLFSFWRRKILKKKIIYVFTNNKRKENRNEIFSFSKKFISLFIIYGIHKIFDYQQKFYFSEINEKTYEIS